ncbi:hypothetical protein BDZ90DRAFT_262168 [Jaminaea rosea]|uniref:Uncharacterized protein n=1 Tax=Jaminaea rosea TaxID=1569628 RepID=A0A316UJX1_9BASI|nr:hypothetical protein BDZ90DRAFT_262168 [Jaminaea rosea]PWN25520.1 hypothetical protein BDZ90DRAFT_262168 [Jaminaea rosea]
MARGTSLYAVAVLTLLIVGSLLASTASASAPYLCKCTCFTTNTTILPLYKPVDPANPCTTCTRQFCIDSNLEGCKGATLENPNADTGTGWEGEVWARCFQRDSGKDQTIVTLYVIVVLSLLVTAAMRDHFTLWWEEFRTGGPQGLIRAVKGSVASLQSGVRMPRR